MDDGEAEEGEEVEGFDAEEVDDDDLLVEKEELDLLVSTFVGCITFASSVYLKADSSRAGSKCPGGSSSPSTVWLSNQAKTIARASAMGQPFPVKKKDPSEEGEEAGSPAEENVRRSFQAEQQLQPAYIGKTLRQIIADSRTRELDLKEAW